MMDLHETFNLGLDIPSEGERALRMKTPGLSFNHPSLLAVWTYWCSLGGQARLPRKSEFDILNVPPAAWPRIFIIEILDGDKNYRVRLQGSYISTAYKRDFTGKRLIESEIPGVTKTNIFKILGEIRARREPIYYFGRTDFRFREDYSDVEQIVLPLTDDQDRVTSVVGALDYPGYHSEER